MSPQDRKRRLRAVVATSSWRQPGLRPAAGGGRHGARGVAAAIAASLVSWWPFFSGKTYRNIGIYYTLE